MKDLTPIAIASRSFSKHPSLRKAVLESYENIRFNDEGASLSGQSLIDFLKGREKAITALEAIDESILSELPKLKVVSKFGVGLDMLDLTAMERRGILLGWKGGVNKRSVSELVVSAAIALLHRVPEASALVRSGSWRQIRGRQLTGKTVGIIGCGNIGKDLAVLLRGFGCQVLAHDILNYSEFYAANGVKQMELGDLLEQSDIVTMHLPLDHSTQNMLDAEHLERMKPGAFLINMARGGLVDENKLKDMLKTGRIAGAALDVFTSEPPGDPELLNMPNVLPTPHIGGSTEEAVLAMGIAAIDGLRTAIPPSQYDFFTI